MNFRALKIAMGVFGISGIVGLCVRGTSHALAWFCFFIAGALQVYIGLKTGEIVSTLGIGRWSCTYRRDETPAFFMWAVIVQSILTIGCGYACLFAL
jgi:hypothetical protein